MGINKRAELHLHTKMSQMDALISPTEAVKVAKYMGLAAVIADNIDTVQQILCGNTQCGEKNQLDNIGENVIIIV